MSYLLIEQNSNNCLKTKIIIYNINKQNMTILIIHTIITCLLSLIGGVVIGMTIVINELRKHTPTQDSYNKFLKKQVKI